VYVVVDDGAAEGFPARTWKRPSRGPAAANGCASRSTATAGAQRRRWTRVLTACARLCAHGVCQRCRSGGL